jgi:predicted  nucleic acid-binding Zn-ribbon protein
MATDLKSQLALLKSLQEIDVLLHQIERELNSIPIRLEEAGHELRSLKQEISQKEAQKQTLEKQKRSGELDIEAEYSRLKEREAKLYAIKTNKEYQAAIKEIADAKQANRDREESILQLMEKIDILTQEITQLSEGIADKEKAFAEAEAEIRKNEGSLKSERDRLAAKSTEEAKAVDPKVLREYRFVQNKFSDALALVTDGICLGCNKRIPPQIYIELQKWKELIGCPNCHRILFYQEPTPQE